MKRLNITLPDDIAEKLAEKPNKSNFIAKALRKEFNLEKRLETERLMKEGYAATVEADKELNAEWEAASVEI